MPTLHKAINGFFHLARKPPATFGEIWHTSLITVATLSKLINLWKMPLVILCTLLWILVLQIPR